jgi:serine/threonine-protein kinase
MRSGELLDGYTLIRRIGAGGYGEVWLCRSVALNDLRALKFIASANLGSLDREFKALNNYRNAGAKLRSPHLMPIEHVGRCPEGLFYVMPLADGNLEDPTLPDWSPTTFATMITERRQAPAWFSCEEIASLMRPVLEALQVLSDAGFVHRDVKPNNLLICGGLPTLADFSLLDEDRCDLTRGGTPGYVAPSWYRGGHPDMYGAAATLYTLLTGNLPDRMGRSAFLGPPQGDQSLTAKERARRKQFHAVIRRATQERVSERYRDFLDMAQALADEPPAATSRPGRVLLRSLAGLGIGVATLIAISQGLRRVPAPETALPPESSTQGPTSVEVIQTHLDRGDFTGALAAMKRLFRQHPESRTDPTLSTWRAIALHGLDRDREAGEELRRDIPLPKEIGAIITRQQLWGQLGDLEGAEGDLTRILETSGPDELLLSMRAQIRARKGDFAGVHADWQAAQNIHPTDPAHRLQVDAMWSPIKKQCPGYLEFLKSKGADLPRLEWIWSLDGKPWIFDDLLSESHVSRSARASRISICHDIDLAFRTGDHRKALILLDRILDAMPGRGNAPDLSLLRALLLQKLGRVAEAEAELRKPCHQQLSWRGIDARIYLWDQLQRWEEAERFLTGMLETPPDSAKSLPLRRLDLIKYRATIRARLGNFRAISADRRLAEEMALSQGVLTDPTPDFPARYRAEVDQIWRTLAEAFPAYAESLREGADKK